jgi:general secretion pathway protein D
MKHFITRKKTPSVLLLTLVFALVSGSEAPSLNSVRLAAQTAPAKKERFFALNFKDVEIAEFLNVMSQLIGKNILIDDKVKGKITISSVKKIPVSEAFKS